MVRRGKPKNKAERRKAVTVTVHSYPKVFEIDPKNFDKELDALLEDLLATKVERIDSEPSVSGRQTANAYFLEIKLPGFSEKDLEIHLDCGNLTIQSTPSEAGDETKKRETVLFSIVGKKNARHAESKGNPFRKIYRLPIDADSRSISASFFNGVLSVEICKKATV
jgi:HSP20 family molecular chaperone IbpA